MQVVYNVLDTIKLLLCMEASSTDETEKNHEKVYAGDCVICEDQSPGGWV